MRLTSGRKAAILSKNGPGGAIGMQKTYKATRENVYNMACGGRDLFL